MTDDFISSFRSERDFDDDFDDDLPEWIGDTEPEDEAEAAFDEEDDFDQLRRKSARASATYDDIETDVDDEGEGISLSHLSPSQRLVLAVLLLLNVIVITVGILLFTGVL
jgi:hypothetical protein